MRMIKPLVFASLAAAALAFLAGMVAQPFVRPIYFNGQGIRQAEPHRLKEHVKFLSVDVYPRSHDQIDKLAAAAEYIRIEFEILGARVELQPVEVDGITYTNIIGHFGPQSSQEKLIVVGAHYDSHGDPARGVPLKNGYDPSSHTPGADDNASGVAGLLELGRLLAVSSLTRPIDLVAYTLEEPPHFRTEHMGSAWHARALKEAGRDVKLMISLEMIGYYSDAPGSQHFPAPGMRYLYPDRGNFLALVGSFSDIQATRRAKGLMAGASALNVHSVNAPRWVQGVDFSDHMNFWNEGVPALMVTDTAFFRNPNYHGPEDTYEKLDYERMAYAVEMVRTLVTRY